MEMRHEQAHFSAGRKSQPPRYSFRSENYDQFQVIYVNEGELHYRDGHEEKVLSPGNLALLREGSAFFLWTEESPYQGVFFIAAGSDEPAFRGAAAAFKASAEIRTLAGLMEREIRAPGPNSQPLLLHLGWVLALEALRLGGIRALLPTQPDYPAAMAESARQALEANIYTARSAREVLSAFKLSYRQLARHFSATFKMPPKQYQLQARMQEAERLLLGTHRSITAIACELGFPSSQYFASQFQAFHKQTPTAFRRRQKSVVSSQ